MRRKKINTKKSEAKKYSNSNHRMTTGVIFELKYDKSADFWINQPYEIFVTVQRNANFMMLEY